MQKHKTFKTRLLSAITAAMTLSLANLPGFAQTPETSEIKIATVYPKTSAVGQLLEGWKRAFAQQTQNNGQLTFFYGGSKGNEKEMVAKSRSKEIDGALFGSPGLSEFSAASRYLEIPGLFPSWAKVDNVLTQTNSSFQQEFSQQGVYLLGWTSLGQNRLMSKGFAVTKPGDLKTRKVLRLAGDNVQEIGHQAIGNVNTVTLGHTEVLTNLNNGAVEALFTSALIADTFQWSSSLDHISADVHSFNIGGIVINKEALDRLPVDVRQALIRTGEATATLISRRMRLADDTTYDRLKSGMTVDEYSAEDKALWAAHHLSVRNQVKATTPNSTLFNQIVELAK